MTYLSLSFLIKEAFLEGYEFFGGKFFSHDSISVTFFSSHDLLGGVAPVANLKISVNSPVLSSDNPCSKFHSVPLISDISATVSSALNSSLNA